MKQKIEKKFLCGLCLFNSDEIDQLSLHYEDKHNCICGSTFYNKDFHNCSGPVQRGGGPAVILEPRDAKGNLVFLKESQAFSDTLATYSYDFKNMVVPLVEDATNLIRKPLISLLKSFLGLHDGIRLKLSFEMLMESPKDSRRLLKKYSSAAIRCIHPNFLDDLVDSCTEYVKALTNLLAHELSGMYLITVTKIFITIMRYKPKIARGYLPLPPILKGRRGIISISERNGQCFLYSVIAGLNYDKIKFNGTLFNEAKGKEKERIKVQMKRPETWAELIKSHKLKHTDEGYGQDLSLMDLFEISNEINLTVFKISKKKQCVVPCRLSSQLYSKSVTLLLIQRSDFPKKGRKKLAADMHFALIYDVSLFFALKKRHYKGICRLCGCCFRQPNHELSCYDNDINLSLPIETKYKYKEMHRLCPPPFVFVYDFLYTGDCNNKAQLNICGFGLIGISCKREQLFSTFYIGNNALDEFFNQLFVNAYYYLERIQDEQIPLAATAEEVEQRKKAKVCVACGREKEKGNPICNHHDHYNDSIKLKHLCFRCNIKAFPKRQIPVYGYGLGRHIKHLMSNLTLKGLKNVFVCPQGSNGFMSLTIKKNIVFLDAEKHFNQTNVHYLMNQLPDTELRLLQQATVEHKLFCYMRKGLPFPNLSITKKEDFEKDCLPDYKNFVDIKYLNTFTEDDYKQAVDAFKNMGCVNMLDYAYASLKSSVYGLGDILYAYADWCMQQFGITPLWDPSLASFSSAACHFYSRTDYELLQSKDIYKKINDNLVGGLSLCNVREVQCTSARLGDSNVECL